MGLEPTNLRFTSKCLKAPKSAALPIELPQRIYFLSPESVESNRKKPAVRIALTLIFITSEVERYLSIAGEQSSISDLH